MNVQSAIPASQPVPLPPIRRAGFTPALGAPEEYGHAFYVSPGCEFSCGVWEADAGTIEIPAYPVTEFCFILSGQVDLVDATGAVQTFRPGMAFVVPVGFRGHWVMPEPTRKYFAAFGDSNLMRMMLGADLAQAGEAR